MFQKISYFRSRIAPQTFSHTSKFGPCLARVQEHKPIKFENLLAYCYTLIYYGLHSMYLFYMKKEQHYCANHANYAIIALWADYVRNSCGKYARVMRGNQLELVLQETPHLFTVAFHAILGGISDLNIEYRLLDLVRLCRDSLLNQQSKQTFMVKPYYKSNSLSDQSNLAIHKPCGTMWTFSWTILLNKAYVVI